MDFLGDKMNRICIIGGSGTGKTTLANNLGKQLNLPVYHIDGINYLSDWTVRNEEERDKIILEKVAEDKWIIDGTYRSTLQQRLERSDYIIYLDYSSFAQVRGILGRFIKGHGKEKQEIPGCEERMSWEFFWWVVNWRKNKRKTIIEILKNVNQEKVHIFNSRRKLNKWYKKKFHEKMEY